jgi:hypothetical protein
MAPPIGNGQRCRKARTPIGFPAAGAVRAAAAAVEGAKSIPGEAQFETSSPSLDGVPMPVVRCWQERFVGDHRLSRERVSAGV